MLPTSGADCLTVTATDDDILEGSEMFTLTIDETDNDDFNVGMNSTAAITITDNEGKKQYCKFRDGI